MEAAERISCLLAFRIFAHGGSHHTCQLVHLEDLPFGGSWRSQLECEFAWGSPACVAEVKGEIYEPLHAGCPLLLWAQNLHGIV